MRHSCTGYTLVEMLMVMAILAIMAGIGAPHVSKAISRYRHELAVRQIVADLSLARAHAKATSASQTVAFNIADSSYTIAGIQSLDGRSNSHHINLFADPYRCTLISADFNGSPQVTFDAYGSADQGGKVVVQCAGIQNSVTVEASSGRASVP